MFENKNDELETGTNPESENPVVAQTETAIDEILTEKFGEKKNSDEAVEYMDSEEFRNALVSKTTKPASNEVETDPRSKVDVDANNNKEEVITLDQINDEKFDLTTFKPELIKKSFNKIAETVREKYSTEIKTHKEELGNAKIQLAEKDKALQDTEKLFEQLGDFITTKFGLDEAKKLDFKKEIAEYAVTKAAEAKGISVQEYIRTQQKELSYQEEARTKLETNIEVAIDGINTKDSLFARIDNKDKVEVLKEHLKEISFDPKKHDIEKIMKRLFVDDIIAIKEQEAINKALKHDNKGQSGEKQRSGNNHKVSTAYNVNEDKEFLKALKEAEEN